MWYLKSTLTWSDTFKSIYVIMHSNYVYILVKNQSALSIGKYEEQTIKSFW